ncbi:hypothetical protein [Helicobacter cetorum]|uniref:Uncharacterized protein n=1 Tax=Helicobacter cetorum (strain ATCC BAA-540 / CCUG 52418 / MIT 99-5656) TaxID=1163745 RepID=I0ESL3_HELCM|nr:hypothetical protein [Helicobacter cetorum]AFI05932.1 hypothetical protein HCD_04630 [Helicobacter cetorum MIT 99-5656]
MKDNGLKSNQYKVSEQQKRAFRDDALERELTILMGKIVMKWVVILSAFALSMLFCFAMVWRFIIVRYHFSDFIHSVFVSLSIVAGSMLVIVLYKMIRNPLGSRFLLFVFSSILSFIVAGQFGGVTSWEAWGVFFVAWGLFGYLFLMFLNTLWWLFENDKKLKCFKGVIYGSHL